MQSKKSVEAKLESEENELKSSNNHFGDDRQGKFNNWEAKTSKPQNNIFLQENSSTIGWLEQ